MIQLKQTENLPWGIHWFRRDLRLVGNLSLIENIKKFNGRTLGIFFFDSNFLKRKDFSHVRFQFFLNTLTHLRNEMRQLGGDILVMDMIPQLGFIEIDKLIKSQSHCPPSLVTFNSDYEPFSLERDKIVTSILTHDLKWEILSSRDHLIIEPKELSKPTGGYYQVYTPFMKKWMEIFQTPPIQDRIKKSFYFPFQVEKAEVFHLKWKEIFTEKLLGKLDALDEFLKINQNKVTISIPKSGHIQALKCLSAFKEKVSDYNLKRDFPSLKGTSQVSIFLKNGSLTTAQIIYFLKLNHLKSGSDYLGPQTYLKEIIWREFYYHILYHAPDVENKTFIKKYQSLKWENNLEFFQRWKEGKTGYPIVDGAMRQLNNTGWMHNRLRMITASFLTKDLLIDYRWGENYFMEKLIDGDLAPNNGGWQWAASTGCDPQPYFRIFNPTLQSEKFDPQGIFIKKWCPEIGHLSLKEIHLPINPIVDHKIQKEKAIKIYKSY
jgi:deoxyribodipyrimidine photo-lyase